MEAPKTIAHEIGGVQNDALRFGLEGVKSEILESHPLQSAYHSERRTQEETKRRILANMYGSAFPMKMDMDRQILSRFQRPPGAVPSSMLGLEALTGDLESFGFEDYLNDPRDSETFRALDMHHGNGSSSWALQGTSLPQFHLKHFLNASERNSSSICNAISWIYRSLYDKQIHFTSSLLPGCSYRGPD